MAFKISISLRREGLFPGISLSTLIATILHFLEFLLGFLRAKKTSPKFPCPIL
jgi:hypothetical protein